MNRGVASALVAAFTLAGLTASAQRTVFRAGTEVVSVPVSVVQGRAPVTGLTAVDFALLDNGVPQTLDAVSLETLPIDVTVILGTAPWTERDRLIRSGESTDRLHEMLRPDDRLNVISAGERVEDRRVRPSADAPMRGREIRPTRGSSSIDAVFYALATPVEPERRHLVVFFTDGRDTWSTLDPDRLAPVIARADAVFHVVFYDAGAAGESGDSRRRRDTVRALQDAARRSGGAEHRLSTRAEAFQQILDDFRSSYLLRYSPRGVSPEGWHDISVTVTRPGSFTIRARRGYQGKAEG